MTSVNSIGAGGEAENEHDERADRHQRPRAVERDVVVERLRVPGTELDEHEHRQDSPGDPARRIEREEDHGGGGRHRDQRGASAERRIGDVPAVELTDREEVQGGHEQAEPGGKGHRMEIQGIPLRRRAPDHPGRQTEQRRLTKREPNEIRGQRQHA